jgi:hypothetical protein
VCALHGFDLCVGIGIVRAGRLGCLILFLERIILQGRSASRTIIRVRAVTWGNHTPARYSSKKLASYASI